MDLENWDPDIERGWDRKGREQAINTSYESDTITVRDGINMVPDKGMGLPRAKISC